MPIRLSTREVSPVVASCLVPGASVTRVASSGTTLVRSEAAASPTSSTAASVLASVVANQWSGSSLTACCSSRARSFLRSLAATASALDRWSKAASATAQVKIVRRIAIIRTRTRSS